MLRGKCGGRRAGNALCFVAQPLMAGNGNGVTFNRMLPMMDKVRLS